MKLNSVGKIMEAASLAINNTAKDAEVGKLMGQYNFPPRRMQEGDNLLTNVKALHNTKETHYDGQWELANRLEHEITSLRPVFTEHVSVARFAFRNDAAVLHALNINRIAANKWDWINQADTFYNKLMAYTEQMSAYGTNAEEIAQAKASVEAIMSLQEERMFIKGKAENSTEMRNQAVKLLKKWVMEFRAAARLALKDNPQKLEAFGMRVRSLHR